MPSVVCVRSLVPKLKNCGFLGDLVGHDAGPRHFDHRADEVGASVRPSPANTSSAVSCTIAWPGSSTPARKPTSGIMISGSTFVPLLLDHAGGFEDRPACIAVISG